MFKFKKKSICAVLLVALMGTMAVGCGQKADQPKQDQQQQQKTEQQGEQPSAADKKEWVLAINATFPPFETIDEENDSYMGIDIDIANHIAEKNGRHLQDRRYGLQWFGQCFDQRSCRHHHLRHFAD